MHWSPHPRLTTISAPFNWHAPVATPPRCRSCILASPLARASALPHTCIGTVSHVLQIVLLSCPTPNPDDFSPLITVLACNGSQACIEHLLRAGCDPLKPYRINLDDAPRGADIAVLTRDAAAPKAAVSAPARPSSSYREAVAIGAMKSMSSSDAPKAVAVRVTSGAAAAAAVDSVSDFTRMTCALDAAAYYGLLPAFGLLLEACKRRITLQQSKSCAAAAAAADQLTIIQHLHATVIGDADSMFWPEAAAIAAARDRCELVEYFTSLSSRAWMQPLNCSVAQYVMLFLSCDFVTSCTVARAAICCTLPPPTDPTASSSSVLVQLLLPLLPLLSLMPSFSDRGLICFALQTPAAARRCTLLSLPHALMQPSLLSWRVLLMRSSCVIAGVELLCSRLVLRCRWAR
jgi:hypothetical protein